MNRSNIALSVAFAGALFAQTPKVDFDRQIRPILSDNCFQCHGPDEKSRIAGLRLDTREGAFADRGKYKILVPGNPGASRLFQRISESNAARRMPPAHSERKLSPAQIALIERWIEQGAEWKTHWAFVPPVRPELPEVKRAAWGRNPVDRFVLARLEREGLSPSPEADRVTLLRRLSFDLTGLPPTPAEISAFLKDRSPGAYEKQVDRLLASPHYGERMSMQWLDIARYADTHGYHIDSHRDMWPWRDWVIRAFNRNEPYDQFALEQIAGDLLPEATQDQRIATGFYRNHMINYEGGAIPEEYLNEYLVDRVEVTGTAWLGLTIGCARCHDHKFDPISQRDFYRLYAFFNAVPEKGLDGRKGNADPVLLLPSPEQAAELKRIKDGLAATDRVLEEKRVTSMIEEWERSARITEPARSGLLSHYEFDGNLADSSGGYRHARLLKGDPAFGNGPVGRALNVDQPSYVEFSGAGELDAQRPFSIAFWLRAGSGREMGILAKVEDVKTRRGYEFTMDKSIPLGRLKEGSHLAFRMTHSWPDSAIEIQTKDRLDTGEWYHIVLNSDGTGRAGGLKLFVDGKPAEVAVLHDSLSGAIATTAPLRLGDAAIATPFKGGLDDLRLYDHTMSAAEIAQAFTDEPARAALFIASGKRTKEQNQRLRDWYLRFAAPGEMRAAYNEACRLNARKEELDWTVLSTMVMEDMEQPRDTYVLARGDYQNRTEKVTPGVPAVLPPLPKGAPLNRLTLARWVVAPANPLTARVAVNRYWQLYFGTGLVKTVEDFGSQGDPPSHPELLDWLATEFVRSGWDVKAMQRLIVTSATYRQSSRISPEMRQRDPENRLLARGPRFRLPAETVRDNALAVSGLIDNRVGGPSVFPYQPNGLWEETAYGGVFSAQTYTPSHGRDLYRRSMYTFWKRTSPPPSLSTFDAPNREKCVARRAVTNTPLQALVLLNDPTYIEAARALASRMLHDGGKSSAQRIRFGFREATGRAPSRDELHVLADLASEESAAYRANPEKAAQLAQVGESPADPRLDRVELAAWTTVASAILNLDEVITKE
jgi:hypothetical protein